MVFILIHLRPLPRVHDIFQEQGVQVEMLADRLDCFGIIYGVDVDPRDHRWIDKSKTFLKARGFPDAAGIFAVADNGKRGFFSNVTPQMDERPGRKPRFGRTACISFRH